MLEGEPVLRWRLTARWQPDGADGGRSWKQRSRRSAIIQARVLETPQETFISGPAVNSKLAIPLARRQAVRCSFRASTAVAICRGERKPAAVHNEIKASCNKSERTRARATIRPLWQ